MCVCLSVRLINVRELRETMSNMAREMERVSNLWFLTSSHVMLKSLFSLIDGSGG